MENKNNILQAICWRSADHIQFQKHHGRQHTWICNSIHPSLTFTPTHEQDKTISIFDLLITKQRTTLDIDIYRKPTATDTTINYQSNHPLEHKMAAYRFLINRMNSLTLSNNNKKKEWNTIKTIVENNKLALHKINKLDNNLVKKQKKKAHKENKKWAIFTYKYSLFFVFFICFIVFL